MNDGEARMVCPFESAHLILKSRMATHLTRCAKNYPGSPWRICPFNGLHYMDQQQFDAHIQICPDRFNAERHVYNTGPAARDVKDLILQAVPTSDENWDEIEESSYLEKRDTVVKEKPILLMGQMNVGKAARKAYLHEERLRLQGLSTSNVGGSQGPAGASSKPIAPRGRGTRALLS